MKKLIRIGLSILVSIILVFVLLSKIEPMQIIETIRLVNIPILALSFLAYFILMVLRAMRFGILTSIKVKDMLPIVFFHNFMNNIVPMKLGELTYVYLTKKKSTFKHSLSSLVLVRIIDIIIIGSSLLIALLYTRSELLNGTINYIIISLALLFLGLVVFLTMPNLIEKILPDKGFLGKIRNIFSFKSYPLWMILKTFALSLGCYFFMMAFTYIMFISMNLILPVNIFLIAISMTLLSGTIPINGIAGFGTIEGVLVLVLSIFGYPHQETIVIAFSLHILQLIFSGIFGFFGWIRVSQR
ncbi:MAG: lysylphosphatidylglycerol synthase transmembrane domain-containing protein [archaeon]